jgi:hypothetical protein
MTINEYGLYEITPLLAVIFNVIIILKTVDYLVFKALKENG